MNAIEKNNQRAEQLKKTRNNFRGFFDISIHDLSKKAPYYGYIETTVNNIPVYMFSNNDDFVAQNFFWNGDNAYEPLSLTIWSLISKVSPCILDIGSYSGIYSLVSCKANHKAKIHAFEALDRVFTRLIINKNVNDFGNMTLYNVAVSSKKGKIELNTYSGDSILVSGSSIMNKNIENICAKKMVQAVSIDDYKFENVGLVKIDAEGAEHLVIEGMINTIRAYQPTLLVELLEGAEIAKIQEMISGLGYNYFQIDELNMKFIRVKGLVVSDNMNNLNTLITRYELSDLNTMVESADR